MSIASASAITPSQAAEFSRLSSQPSQSASVQPSSSDGRVSAFEQALQADSVSATSTASQNQSAADAASSSSASGTSSENSAEWQAFDKAFINSIESMGIQQLSQFRENLQQAYST